METIDLGAYVPNKRQRASKKADPTEFAKGTVMRVKMKNFMSFALTEFHFGPHMNFIIGPNGSGKSTFVCAICIGLCGKLAYLGKASMNTDQFIKSGCTEGFVEIELKGNGDSTVVIKRELLAGVKSNWFLNGRTSTERAIKEILNDMNIQLDNLCQFLPQDRVAKFPSLKPEDLLREIERSYGDGELLEQHNELIALAKDKFTFQENLQNVTNDLERLKSKNSELTEKVAQYKNYTELLKTIEMYKNLVPLAELHDSKHQVSARKQAIAETKQELALFRKTYSNIGIAFKELEENDGENEEKDNKLATEQRHFKKEIDKYKSKIEEINQTIERLRVEKQGVGKNKEMQMAKLEKARENFNAAREKFLQIQNSVIPEEDLNQLKQKRDELYSEFSNYEDVVKTHERELETLGSVLRSRRSLAKEKESKLNSTDKLDKLDPRVHGNLIKAVKFLRSHKEINGLWFEPPLLCLIFTDKRYSKALENVVKRSDLGAITLRDRAAYDTISALLEDAKIYVPLRTLGKKTNVNSPLTSAHIKGLGFDGFLSEFVTGTPEVLQMLEDNDRISSVPVKLRQTNKDDMDNIERTKNSLNIPVLKFVDSDSVYTMSSSRYGKKQTLTVSTNLRPLRLFNEEGMTAEQKAEIQGQIISLNQEIDDLQNNMKTIKETQSGSQERLVFLKKEYNSVLKEIKVHTEMMKNKTKYESSMKLNRNEYNKLKEVMKQLRSEDLGKKTLAIISDINKLQEKKLNLEDKIFDIVCLLQANASSNMKLNLKRVQEKNKFLWIEQLNLEIQENEKKIHAMIEQNTQEYADAKNNYRTKLKEYKEKVEMFSSDLRDKVSELYENLKQEGTYNIDSIRSTIRIKENELSRFRNVGADVISNLKQNEEEILKCEENIPQYAAKIESLSKKIRQIDVVWRPKLEEIVKRISDDFSLNLVAVASAGEVQLYAPDSEYAKWRLEIKVKFRESAELSILNAAQQSGGEKSAATAVFLNSLQGLTNTPFRIVDEINQGLDARNERLIHKLIVQKATSDVKSSQYFLITPKLLTNLHYCPGMTVHCILAGKWAPPSSDTPQFLEAGISEKYIYA